LAKQIGQLKSRGEDASELMTESQAIPARLKELEARLGAIQVELSDWLLNVPNLPHESVPAGESSDDNVEVRRWLPGNMQADAEGNPPKLGFETAITWHWVNRWDWTSNPRASFRDPA